ncbi:TRAP transporter substrate-binding protein [Cetobacterium sp.]|uniref:TRAP transporter substrate-binding protein n=2 Tax=Cetobacterium sp. TaxID=2071632 RepID=UPI003EE539EF
MKKIVNLGLGVVFAGVLMGCSGDKNQETTKSNTLKVAFNQSEAHPQYKALKEFGDKFEKETNGQYKLEISPNALLGDQRAVTELVQNGVIQMAVVGNPVVENFNKDFAVIGLPYIYDSIDHQKNVFLSGKLDELFKSVGKNGFEVVGAYTAGARSVYTNKPIEKPEDLKGYKVRVMQSDTMKKMVDLMGGVGTPMAQGEVYTAIQQGVLEGGENNEVTYADLKHYEVAKYFSYTNHLMVPDLIIINEKVYSGMTKENKEVFDKLVKESVDLEFKAWEENVNTAKKLAEENGAQFINLSIKPFQDNVKPLQESVRNSSEITKKIYDDIRSLAQ